MAGARQSGRTTAICKVAKELDGVVIAAHAAHARHIEIEYGVKSVPLSQLDCLIGSHAVVLWDHFTAEHMLQTIESLDEEVSKKNKKIAKLEKDNVAVRAVLRGLAHEFSRAYPHGCWCDLSHGSPLYKTHSESCVKAQAVMKGRKFYGHP